MSAVVFGLLALVFVAALWGRGQMRRCVVCDGRTDAGLELAGRRRVPLCLPCSDDDRKLDLAVAFATAMWRWHL